MCYIYGYFSKTMYRTGELIWYVWPESVKCGQGDFIIWNFGLGNFLKHIVQNRKSKH